ncbi:efflux RND transporter periplasmic adaptor subunit [Verrucomicrobiota bacterium sgz303538]
MKKIAIVLVLAAGGFGTWKMLPAKTLASAKEQQAAAPGKSSTRAEKRDISFNVEVSGDVTPAFQLEVKPEVGGKLKALHVEPGQSVTAGDLLVEIDDRDLLTEKDSVISEIEGAKLSVDKSKKNFERGQELFEAKLISREVFDNLSSEFAIAENGLVRAERKLQLVEDKLRKTKVIAPSDGTVLTVPVIEGQVVIGAASVNSGTTLMTIANLSRLLVETHINQVDVSKLELNKKVKLRAESLRDLEMEATISFIAPIATPKNNVKGFQVQALIEKPNPRLRPGMTVNLTIPVAKADGAVSVPIAAVFKGDNNARVVYVRNGDATEKREVKVGVTSIEYAQILHGVNEGEEILLTEPDRNPSKQS